jgi:hypothetical protein
MTTSDGIHYIQICALIHKLLGRRISVFLLTGDPGTVTSFRNIPWMDTYWLHSPYPIHPRDSAAALRYISNLRFAVLSTFYIGTFQSNVDRLLLEIQAVSYNGPAHLFLEAGQNRCFSAAHCKMMGSHYDYVDWWFPAK